MESPPPPKKSTAEHFADLRVSVDTMRTQMSDVHDYVVKARQRLDEDRNGIIQELSRHGAKVIFGIYCTTYKHLQNRQGDPDDQTAYLHTLQEMIAEELKSFNCRVQVPSIGESFQATWMTSLERTPLAAGAQEGTIARVHSPGLMIAGPKPIPLEKAQVAVFRAEEAKP